MPLRLTRHPLWTRRRPDSSIVVQRMLPDQLQQSTYQPPRGLTRQRSVTPRYPWLSQRPVHPALGNTQPILDFPNRLPPASRARQFPYNASRTTALSSSASADSRFSRFFSSNCFSRFAFYASIPPYLFRRRWHVCSPISRAWHIWPIVLPPLRIASAFRSNRTICSALCRFTRRGIKDLLTSSETPLESHKTRISFLEQVRVMRLEGRCTHIAY